MIRLLAPRAPSPASAADAPARSWATRLLRGVAAAWRRLRDDRALAALPAGERERFLEDTWAERRFRQDEPPGNAARTSACRRCRPLTPRPGRRA